jgi:hypothetical protein
MNNEEPPAPTGTGCGAPPHLRLIRGTNVTSEIYDDTDWWDAPRARLYGVIDLRLAMLIAEELRAAGVSVNLDIGLHGWPATLWVHLRDEPEHVRSTVARTLRQLHPLAARLRIGAPRSESLRVAAAQAVAASG